MPVLRVDAHFTVVEATLKGYMKWRATHGSNPQADVRTLPRSPYHTDFEQEQERNNMETNLEAWCGKLLDMNIEVWRVEIRDIALG